MYDSTSSSSSENSNAREIAPVSGGESAADTERDRAAWQKTIWEKALFYLKEELDAQIFSAYLRPLRLHSFDPAKEEAIIYAPSAFVCNHIERVYLSRIILALGRAVSDSFRAGFNGALSTTGTEKKGPGEEGSLSVRLCVDPIMEANGGNSKQHIPFVVVKKVGAARAELSSPYQNGSSAESSCAGKSDYTLQRPTSSLVVPSIKAGSSQNNLGPARVRQFDTGLNSKYTFANFIVGNNNQFSHAASMRVAEQPGQSYNPLFIYGGVGLGKTHLLHAIGNAVLEKNSSARVVYLSSESFTNELILALRNAKMDEFKRRMRSIELLLIDDIQFMCGKERTQEEFFHTFNTLYDARHQIVLTSDKIPQEIPGIEERLQTRFSWGLTADLQAPDFETRVAILKRKASIDGYALPEEVAQFIAGKISSNVRELEGALTRLSAVSSLQGVDISLSVAESALRPLLQPKPISITILDIKKIVAEHFGIKVADIISKRRTKNLSFPRHIAMYLCRKHTTSSYPEIGGQFGGRDHSSVIHAANVVGAKISKDARIKDLVGDIERKLLQS